MKVALLTQIINKKSGSRAPLEIARALKKKGVYVTIFAYKLNLEETSVKELKKLKIPIVILPHNFFMAPLVLLRALKLGGFDIVSLHGSFPLFIGAKLSAIPIVKTYYGTQFDPIIEKYFTESPMLAIKMLNKLVNFLTVVLEYFMLRFSSKLIAISNYTKNEAKKLYSKTCESVYLGPSIKKTSKSYKNKNDDISILSVSRIVPYKGFHKLISVFNNLYNKYPNIRLAILGSSPNKSYLTYLKYIAKKDITILTDVNDKELARAYQKANIYATFDRYPFFGMPILDASVFGIPSVAIDRCASPELILHKKTGFLAKNEKEFEAYLELLVINGSKRITMGRNAYLLSKQFSWNRLAKRYINIFQHVKLQPNNSLATLIFIIILGLLIRIAFINRHTFWFDEAFSYFVSQQPIFSIIQTSAFDTIPPFYYIFLKLWSQISHEVWFLRLLSLIFGVSSIPIAYTIFKKFTNKQTSLLATFFFAVSPLLVYFSVETRMYSLLVFESLLLILLFLKFFESKKKLYLILLSILGILAVYTHYYSALVILVLNIIFFMRFKQYQRHVNAWVISQLAIIMAFIPWGFILQSSKADCWCFHPVIGVPAMFASFSVGGMGVATLKEIITHAPKPIIIFFSLTAISTFLLFLKGLLTLVKTKHQDTIVLFFVPLIVVSSVSFLYPVFSPRAFIIIAPFYYLFVSIGFLSFKNTLWRNVSKIVVSVLLLSTLLAQWLHPLFYGPPFEKAANILSRKFKNKEIIVHLNPITFYSFLYFHNFSYKEFILKTEKNSKPLIASTVKSFEELTPYSSVWIVSYPYWQSQVPSGTWQSPNQIESISLKEVICYDRKHCQRDNTIELYRYAPNKSL